MIVSMFVSMFLQAQDYNYIWLHPTPQGNTIWAIAFANETTGYAVGDYGYILKSVDSGTGTSGYEQSDYNLDGEVDNSDKNEIWVKNPGIETQVPE